MARLNVILLVVDSLRATSVSTPTDGEPRGALPFLRRLRGESVCFERAYATECWTLPSHASMFTGLLPSQHGAHFRTMGYFGAAPTAAEILAAEGFHTEVVTRNSVFDGTIPGINRGFRENTCVLAGRRPSLCSLLLALSKPRFRRQIRATGFFHPQQRSSREFVWRFARATLPADERALGHVLARAISLRRRSEPFFLFCNLYDVHAPYSPSPNSIFRPVWPPSGWLENSAMPFVLPKLGSHRYLREGFRLAPRARAMLLSRYRRAIELMDAKLARFYDDALACGLLADTVLIVASDHGEGFGEHGLYLHDSSLYEEHLHVPLWVRHPDCTAEIVGDLVSTKDLFGVIVGAARGHGVDGTLLDSGARGQAVLASHFHYPHGQHAAPRYRQDLAAAVGHDWKVITRGGEAQLYDLAADPGESLPTPCSAREIEKRLRRGGMTGGRLASAMAHLRLAA